MIKDHKKVSQTVQINTSVSQIVKNQLDFSTGAIPVFQKDNDSHYIDYYRDSDPLHNRSFDPISLREMKESDEILAATKNVAENMQNAIENTVN